MHEMDNMFVCTYLESLLKIDKHVLLLVTDGK